MGRIDGLIENKQPVPSHTTKVPEAGAPRSTKAEESEAVVNLFQPEQETIPSRPNLFDGPLRRYTVPPPVFYLLIDLIWIWDRVGDVGERI